jgi:hypothetical protein
MQENSRWWEFYFVRYAIGTLTGALLVNQVPRLSDDLAKIIFFQIDLQKETYAGTPLLLAYGLLFCYIASIPILIWHSARFVIPKARDFIPSWFRKRVGPKPSTFKKWLAIGLVIVSGLLFFGSYMCFSNSLTSHSFLIKLVIMSSLFVLWMEWGALIWLMANMERAYQSLKSLSTARNNNENKGGIIDSYRHLREHGNSILIVLLELVLGGFLLGMLHIIDSNNAIDKAEKINTYATYVVPVLVLWMLPGAVVWLVATSFEKRFVELEGAA